MDDAACRNEFGGVHSRRIWSSVCSEMRAFVWVPRSCSCVWSRLDIQDRGIAVVVHGLLGFESSNFLYLKNRSLICCVSSWVSCSSGGGVVGAERGLGGCS